METIDMRHSSKKAWAMIKKLSCDPRKPGGHINVTPDQIASVLLLNGKSTSPGGRHAHTSNVAGPVNVMKVQDLSQQLKLVTPSCM